MFRIVVEGDYALFTRPECKVERVTYPVPTPSALEGLLKSVYWKPSIRYVIDKIVVFNEIKYFNLRRNEVKSKILYSKVKAQMNGEDKSPVIYTKLDDEISQRASMMLKDVKYGIEFHFELTGIRSEDEENGDAKHASIIRRRMEKGQAYRTPCLGCRELAVKSIKLVDEFDYSEVHSEFKGEHDLGIMLYGLKFNDNPKLAKEWNSKYFSDNADAIFYHPYIVDGVIDVEKYKGVI